MVTFQSHFFQQCLCPEYNESSSHRGGKRSIIDSFIIMNINPLSVATLCIFLIFIGHSTVAIGRISQPMVSVNEQHSQVLTSNVREKTPTESRQHPQRKHRRFRIRRQAPSQEDALVQQIQTVLHDVVKEHPGSYDSSQNSLAPPREGRPMQNQPPFPGYGNRKFPPPKFMPPFRQGQSGPQGPRNQAQGMGTMYQSNSGNGGANSQPQVDSQEADAEVVKPESPSKTVKPTQPINLKKQNSNSQQRKQIVPSLPPYNFKENVVKKSNTRRKSGSASGGVLVHYDGNIMGRIAFVETVAFPLMYYLVYT